MNVFGRNLHCKKFCVLHKNCPSNHTTVRLQHDFLAADASNDAHMRSTVRERTVPIPDSIIHVPGYPEKLAIFKMQASKFWQVRCWHNGKTFRKSTKSQSQRSALIFARVFMSN